MARLDVFRYAKSICPALTYHQTRRFIQELLSGDAAGALLYAAYGERWVLEHMAPKKSNDPPAVDDWWIFDDLDLGFYINYHGRACRAMPGCKIKIYLGDSRGTKATAVGGMQGRSRPYDRVVRPAPARPGCRGCAGVLRASSRILDPLYLTLPIAPHSCTMPTFLRATKSRFFTHTLLSRYDNT